ncbi:MAG: hypothetical protein ACI4NP_03630 [Thermoguttaceae bacterium]
MNVILYLFAIVASFFMGASASLNSNTLQAQDASAPSWNPSATAESLGLEPYSPPQGLFPLFPWDHLQSWGADYQSLEDAMTSMRECEFTLSAFVDTLDKANEANKNGLLCLYETGVEIFDDRELTAEEIATKCAKIDEKIEKVVQETKDLPNVIGYYIVDEPGAYKFKALAAAVAAVKKYAPGKLAYINLYPGYASTIGADVDSQLGVYSYEEYLERFVQEVKPQFLSYDNYMIEYSEDMRDFSRAHVFFTDLFTVRRIALKYNLPIWFIGSSLCIQKESSPPTPARLALQSYLPLAAGARAMTWFLYYPLGWTYSPIDRDGKKTLTWMYMRDVNVQVKNIGGYLANFKSTDMGMDPIYSHQEAPSLPQFPAVPQKVLPSLKGRYSGNAKINKPTKIAVGEFERLDGNAVAALAVNMDFDSSVCLTFEKPQGFNTLKVVSPVDGSEKIIDNEDAFRKEGFWIIPGHGTLFVWEK